MNSFLRALSCYLLILICIESEAAHYNCVNGHRQLIDMDDFYRRDETFMPVIPDEPRHKRLSYKSCKWDVTVRSSTGHENRQLVLEGLPENDVTDEPGRNRGEWLVKSDDKMAQNISAFPGMIQVLSLSHRKHLSLEISWDPKTQARSPVNLRILIPIPGFCSRDMLSFHGNCHTVSQLPHSVTVAMRNMKGDAQLASFISMSQINDFIAANNDRLKVRPWRLALELSEAVRVAVFYNATDGRILSVMRSERGCELREVERPEEMLTSPVTGPCGSLRVDKQSGRAVMEFGNCSRSVKSLVSFPEKAMDLMKNAECGTILALQIQQLKTLYETKMLEQRLQESGSGNSMARIVDTVDRKFLPIRNETASPYGDGLVMPLYSVGLILVAILFALGLSCLITIVRCCSCLENRCCEKSVNDTKFELARKLLSSSDSLKKDTFLAVDERQGMDV